MIKILIRLTKGIILFFFIIPCLSIAEVITEAYINRTTYLTGEDAKSFYAIFTKNYSSDAITIICDKYKETCKITTQFSGIGGAEAKRFIEALALRERTDFLTKDKKFGITCGHTAVKAFCNFYQQHAILLDAPLN